MILQSGQFFANLPYSPNQFRIPSISIERMLRAIRKNRPANVFQFFGDSKMDLCLSALFRSLKTTRVILRDYVL